MDIKLIIWDLDDTLWRGTLNEGDTVKVIKHRADIVHALNQCGVISSICSKNDFEAASQILKDIGLWDQFVFPRIAFVPKAAAIRQMIEDMQLRPVNVLFIDDNEHNLQEVKSLLPDIHVTNASRSESDDLLQHILCKNKHHKKSRLEDYRILQAKFEDRHAQAISNEEFLKTCDIHITFPYRMDNLNFVKRIEELVNRSNQLNYTESRVEDGSLVSEIIGTIMTRDVWSVFAWDKYGYYGLVGFAIVNRASSVLTHFVFSCRIMHMGIERRTINMIREKYPQIDLSCLKKELPAENPNWIKHDYFSNPIIREFILIKEGSLINDRSSIRIMYDCQSGGIAHFSRWRNIIDFDNYPRFFGLWMMVTDEYKTQNFPPMLVYGVDSDYPSVDRWPGISLTRDVYVDCVKRFCDFIMASSRKAFIILPPDDAPEDQYTPKINLTRARTVEFNSVWKEYAMKYSCISIYDMSGIIQPFEMYNVGHYYAAFLKKIAGHMDDWYEKNRPILSAMWQS